MATTRASGYVVTHTVWNDVLSGLTDNGQTYSGNFTGVITAVISATAFGNHTISAGGTGGNELRIRNTTAGTGNYAGLNFGNDAGVGSGFLYVTSTTYTPSGRVVADGLHLETNRAGGISIAAVHASGDIRFYTGGSTTPAVTIDDAGYTTINRLITPVSNPGPGTQNDYNIGGASVILFTNGLSACTMTGITGGSSGRQIWVLRSAGSAADITLNHEDAGSTAANRFTCVTGANITVTSSKAVQMIYDGNTSRWIVFDTK